MCSRPHPPGAAIDADADVEGDGVDPARDVVTVVDPVFPRCADGDAHADAIVAIAVIRTSDRAARSPPTRAKVRRWRELGQPPTAAEATGGPWYLDARVRSGRSRRERVRSDAGRSLMPVWLTEEEYRTLEAMCERLIPGDPATGAPGAGSAGVADYIDGLLGAFSVDPPRIWAGGPTSGRHGGPAGFAAFHRLGRLDELAWRTRIEGSRGLPEREFNGPVTGWQERYRAGLAALGGDFGQASPEEQDERMHAQRAFTRLVYGHCCEGMYGAPEYGGNRDGAGWRAIDFAGDVQPRGWTDAEVSGP